MSLGKKLANYRKLAGLTQQQLGEALDFSPQAISKWENDLAEPDLSTLRALSELYKVPIGEMIDPNIGVSEPPIQEASEEFNGEVKEEFVEKSEEETKEEQNSTPIGFCKTCGIIVTEETVGEKTPSILCKKCRDKRNYDAHRAAEELKKKEKARFESNRYLIKRKITISSIVAGLVSMLFITIMIASAVNTGNLKLIPVTLIGSYIVFAFVACLFYDCVVSDIFLDWTCKSFRFPGLIFTFDLDGIIWLIGMKLLFWLLGLLLGLFSAMIGIAIGMVCAPFVFPFIMRSLKKSFINGTESSYVFI